MLARARFVSRPCCRALSSALDLPHTPLEGLHGDEGRPSKLITRVALTGGPCGGKSTALAQLKDRLVRLGYRVFTVPEAFTLLYNAGTPRAQNVEQVLSFNTALLRVQLALEDACYDAAKALADKPAVILCDRGLLDNRAYSGEKLWPMIVENLHSTNVKLRDTRYDAVVHMTTAADGAEEFYSLGNNAARSESPEEARALDGALKEAWLGHPHLYIIKNKGGFESKVRRAVQCILAQLGAPRAGSYIRKFVLPEMPASFPKELNTERFEYVQTYLNSPAASPRKARVWRREQRGITSYRYQSWVPTGHKRHFRETLVERALSGREYLVYLGEEDEDAASIRKEVVYFHWDNQHYSLHNYKQMDLVLLEVEAHSLEEALEVPPLFEVGREVTEDEWYNSYHLACHLKSSGAL